MKGTSVPRAYGPRRLIAREAIQVPVAAEIPLAAGVTIPLR
jgi:hypothetical protein